MRRILAVLALVAACALLAGLLAGCGPNATEKKIAAELTARANELCWEAGGLPEGEARNGWAETVVSVNCNEVGPPRPAPHPCPPAGGWPALERELREGGR
jgi:hypothetical protein